MVELDAEDQTISMPASINSEAAFDRLNVLVNNAQYPVPAMPLVDSGSDKCGRLGQ